MGKSLKNGVGIASGESWPPFQMVCVSGHKQSPSLQRIWVFLHVLWWEGPLNSGETAATFQHQPRSADEETLSLEFHVSAIISKGEHSQPLRKAPLSLEGVVPPPSRPAGCGSGK